MARKSKPDKKSQSSYGWDDELIDDEDELDDLFPDDEDDGYSRQWSSGNTATTKKTNPVLVICIVLLAVVFVLGGAYGVLRILDRNPVVKNTTTNETIAPAPDLQNTPAQNPQPAAATPAPATPAPWTGMVFETTDTDGNTVRSQDLFSQHTVTMVNVWASWCGPCVGELPELQRLNGEFAAKNCAIVGVMLDGGDADGLRDGLARMQEAGVTYTVLLPWADVDSIFPAEYIPTSFFVDSGGHIIGDPIVGAAVNDYAPGLDAAIAAAQSGAAAGTTSGTVNSASQSGPWQGLSFETKDVYGNTVRSQDLFSQNKVTMVNVWTSWCGYCVDELPDLERLNGEFAAKGCAIVGILMDGNEAAGDRDGRAEMKAAGVTYTVLRPWDGAEQMFPVTGYPTSFFVDSNGNIIGDPIVGAAVGRYSSALDDAIAASGN